MDVAVQGGHIGPIRFAATPTSYPHLCQALAALTTKEDVVVPEQNPGLPKWHRDDAVRKEGG